MRPSRRNSAGVVVAIAAFGATLIGPGPAPPAGAATNEPTVSLVSEFGGYGHGYPGSLQFRFPWGVDVDADGDYYVVERGLDRIRHVSAEGADLSVWGSDGSGNGQFKDPKGVAVAPDGTVYVADTENDRIQRFDEDGDFLTSWGALGTGDGQFNEPSGVAVAADGTVYVADSRNDRIQAFDATGAFLTKWGPGANPVDFPNDVAVAPDGSVLVANDDGTAKVQRYTASGAFVAQWISTTVEPLSVDAGPDGRVYITQKTTSTSPHRGFIIDAALTHATAFGETLERPVPVSELDRGLLWAPKGLAVDADGVVTVVDSDTAVSGGSYAFRTDWLSRFDADGGFVDRLGSADNASMPHLARPADVALAPSGDQYVVEVVNHRVQRLTSTGAYVSHWGGPFAGTGTGQFDAPESLTVDASGDVFVTDTGNDRVQRFSADGTFEAQWGSTGSGHGQFDGPSGIAVDDTGDVFVADSGNDRVQRFSSAGVFELAWSGSLDDPGDVVVGQGPSVYVVDAGHRRVLRFTRAGGAMPMFEEVSLYAAFTPRRFQGAVAVDANGNLYVARDGGVAKYTRSGAFVREWDLGLTWRSAVAVDGLHRLVTFYDRQTETTGSLHQLATGSFVTVRAGFDDPSGSVGALLRAKVMVANTGTTTLTGLSVSDPSAPACGGPVPDLAPGEEHLAECLLIPSAVGALTHTATVDTDQTSPLASEPASVEVSLAAGPVLLDEWGVAGEGPGQLDSPDAIAVDHTGDVLIANTGNDVVSRFGFDGTFESEFASPDPVHVETDLAGNVVTMRVVGLVGTGELRRSSPDGILQWTAPVGYAEDISTAEDGRTWYVTPDEQECDWFNCQILSEPRVLRVNGAGGADGSFLIAQPNANTLAVHDGTDRVYVRYLSAIYRYTRSGQLLGAFPLSTLDGLRDLDVDASGRLYAALRRSSEPDVVKVLDEQGTVLARWETPGADGVSVAPDGTVYVLDEAGGRVRRYGFGLTGVVTETGTGDPVGGAWAIAVDARTGAMRGLTAGADGRFLGDVGLGDRWVGFLDPTGTHTGEWHDDVPLSDLASAAQVPVAANAPNVVNAALTPAGRTARVAGTVRTSPGGAPAPGVFVGVVDLSDGTLAAGAVTGGDGTYAVTGLGAGAHLVVFLDPSGGHQIEFFDDSTVPTGADVVTLQPGQTTTADASLAAAAPAGAGAGIEGTVTGGGEPLEGALVVALDAADFSFVRGGFTDAGGHYDLDLPPGTYRVEFVDPAGAHAGEWHDDHPITDLAGSTPVVVGAGPPVTVDADLEPSGYTGSIAGTVTGPANEATQGGWVVVLDAATFGFVGGATVDADGEYVVDGLGAGDYVVGFLDPTGALVTEWHDDAADVGSATSVRVTAGEATGVDAWLAAV